MAEDKPEIPLEDAIECLYRLGMIRYIPRRESVYFSKQGITIENDSDEAFMTCLFRYDGRRLE